ncbi:MAG: hypothetical protein GQ530_04310 [Desulfuromonadales bacterium]|nr:hypothetical protein [Desulfuromonadales bacterium]
MRKWEDTCKRCGLCCFEKSVDLQGQFVTTRIPCRHLDIISRQCRVYHKRLDVGEGCVKLTPEVVQQADWLPEGCAYRANVRNS